MASLEQLDSTYMNMATELAQLSYAEKRKVGCLVVKDTQIISEGYNGTPRGFDNKCEYLDCVDQLWTKKEVLHAESNALTKLARSTNSSQGATLYVTCCPCFDCAKLIIQSGIERVIYKESYTKGEGLTLLQQASIEVNQL